MKQKIADSAMLHVLCAIRDIEKLEKIVCGENDLKAMKAANKVLISLRKAKGVGMASSGRGDVQIEGGGT